MRSALGPGSDPGLGRADGPAEGTVAALPPLARTRLPAARPRGPHALVPGRAGTAPQLKTLGLFRTRHEDV